MKQLSFIQSVVMMGGGVALLLGAVLYIKFPVTGFVLFAVGALCFGCMQMLQQYEGHNFVINRLRRQQMLGALALMVAAGLMCMHTFRVGFAQGNEWVVAMAVGCVLELYTALRLPVELEKEA